MELPFNLKVLLELPTIKSNKNIWPKGWKTRTSLMGVINVTPDSFSDGGDYLNPEKARLRAIQFLNDGVDVIDIGGQSTKPKADLIGAEEESRRLLPALLAIREINKESLISVDTFHSKVAELAINSGANWINDVSGGRYDSKMFSIAAEAVCPYILTHSRGDSNTMDDMTSYENLIIDVKEELLRSTDKAVNSGVLTENIIWDPGLGFAKNTEQNITLIKNIDNFTSERFPILIGPSRKRFIGSILNESNPKLRIWGTAAIACLCVKANVSMIRVHDVEAIAKTIKMAENIF